MSTIKGSWSRVADAEKFRSEVDRIFRKRKVSRKGAKARDLTAKSAKNTKARNERGD